jgi:hypothetical protein
MACGAEVVLIDDVQQVELERKAAVSRAAMDDALAYLSPWP